MNQISIESSKRWQDKGLFQDSEFVYVTKGGKAVFNFKEPILRGEAKRRFGCEIQVEFVSAPHCEEMGDYLYDTLGLHTGRYEREFWAIYDKDCDQVEVVRAVNETEAREKAINWDLDQQEKG